MGVGLTDGLSSLSGAFDMESEKACWGSQTRQPRYSEATQQCLVKNFGYSEELAKVRHGLSSLDS